MHLTGGLTWLKSDTTVVLHYYCLISAIADRSHVGPPLGASSDLLQPYTNWAKQQIPYQAASDWNSLFIYLFIYLCLFIYFCLFIYLFIYVFIIFLFFYFFFFLFFFFFSL